MTLHHRTEKIGGRERKRKREGGGREREREERDRETQRETERQRQTATGRDRERQRDRQRDRDPIRQREGEVRLTTLSRCAQSDAPAVTHVAVLLAGLALRLHHAEPRLDVFHTHPNQLARLHLHTLTTRCKHKILSLHNQAQTPPPPNQLLPPPAHID